ncbi:D-2-hydroxyacid dehydrogenase [Planctomicrobium sp. SH664]|uniref:D-2-hydroxyacid dehydrogenase n=1 Tax=Planctomicrobium sp. SH664 TaxID=3448125 RepID=UPI003F5C7EFE
MKLVISPAIDAERLAHVMTASGPMRVVNCETFEDTLREIPDADAFFGKLTPPLLAAAQRLRWVQTPTVSLEHYMFPELVEHPCQLTNMRGLFSDVIADHVMGLVLTVARNLHRYWRLQQQARWEPVGIDPAQPTLMSSVGLVSAIDLNHRHLPDCTLGVVGVGEIGSEICRRAAAFGMRILGVDPQRRSVPGIVEEVWPVERLNELLAESDFVVIAAPHTPETVGLFRLPQFEQMKREGWLINIGRGAIVSLPDLVTALQRQLIAGAALDVFEIEPLPADHPLWKMENVLITPHVAAASPRIAERHLATLLENIRRFVKKEPFLTPADKRKWY